MNTEPQSKPHIKSKTHWFNAACLIPNVLAIAELLNDNVEVLGLNDLQLAVASMTLNLVMALGNFYLRSITTKPVH